MAPAGYRLKIDVVGKTALAFSVDHGPVEPLSAAAALLALVLGLVAVGHGIHPRSMFPGERVLCLFGC